MKIHISPMTSADYPAVAAIYQAGIDTGNATFASQPPASWEDWCSRKINSCSLVARDNGLVVGWAALSPTSSREVYAGVAEVSIYVSSQVRGSGVGTQLMEELIRVSEASGIWTLQAGIFPENRASLALHYRCGFRRVGCRHKVGRMSFGPHMGQWRDVYLLERRSQVVGVE